MKVLQVLPALNNGGVERGTLEIARALVEAGHESAVISAGGRLVGVLAREGSVHHKWNIGKKSLAMLFEVSAVRRWLTEQRFDIVHVRSRMPAWVIWLAWRKMDPATRPRLVSTVHGMHSVSRYSGIVTCGERVIVVSESVKRYVLDNYPKTDPSKLQLIYRGIDPQDFPYGYRPSQDWLDKWYQDFPHSRGRKIITLPGRLTRLKGHHYFLPLLAELLANDMPVTGLIVGGEDPKRQTYANELYKEAARLGLSKHLVFTGHRSDMRDIYAISDVVLSLSEKPESFGRTVLEPLAMGVPVVGWDYGGVGEVLQRLFPEGAVAKDEVGALKDKLLAVLCNDVPPVSTEQPFLLEDMCQQTLALYEEMSGLGV